MSVAETVVPPVVAPPVVTPPPVAPPVGGDWTASLTPELKEIVTKNGFTDPAGVVKAYAGLQPLIGADKIPAPTKEGVWSDEALTRLGVPKDGAYKIERPAMPEGVTYDEAFEKAAFPVAAKLGLTAHQVKGLIDFQTGYQAEMQKGAAAAQTAAQAETQAKAAAAVDALKTEWGQAFAEKSAFASRAIQHLAGLAKVPADQLEALTKDPVLGNHPVLSRIFAEAGKMLGEDTLKLGGSLPGAMTPADAMAEANKLMRMPEYTSQDPVIRKAANAKVEALFKMANPESAAA